MSQTNPDDARYTLTELADLAGVSPRTVRYYLAQGLLPSVGVAGPGAKYDDAHLARLRLIRGLQRQHLPLADIRRQLEPLDDDQVVALAEPAPAQPPDSALDYIRRVMAPAPPLAIAESAMAYRIQPPPPDPSTGPTPRMERSQWERIALGPDIELHVRRPLPRSTAKRVDRLVSIARDLLEEDLP